jgi:hypothetical protein
MKPLPRNPDLLNVALHVIWFEPLNARSPILSGFSSM